MAHDYSVPNRMEPGGQRFVVGGDLDVESGGEIDIESGGSLKIAGTALTPTAAEINKLAGVTAGTVTANKAVVVGANKNVDELHMAAVYLGAGAGTQVSATAAEINKVAGVTAGTVTANKAVVVGANKNVDEIHTAALYMGAAAGTEVTAVAAELNKLDGVPLGAHTFTVGAEGGNTINVAIQLLDGAGAELAVRGSVLAYLSDDANGDSIAASAPDGGWAIGTDGLLIPVVAGKCAQLVSESDGDIDINIIHAAGALNLYLILVLPNGALRASGVIAFT